MYRSVLVAALAGSAAAFAPSAPLAGSATGRAVGTFVPIAIPCGCAVHFSPWLYLRVLLASAPAARKGWAGGSSSGSVAYFDGTAVLLS